MSPTLILKFIGGSAGLGGGIAGSVFSSFQAFTKISIEEFLKDDWFDYTDNSDWKLLKGKLDSSKNQNKKILEETKLKEAKKPETGVEEGNENGQKLNDWCKKIKNTKVKKFLSSNYETILLDYVKSFCIISIGEKLTSESQFTDWSEENKTTLKNKANNLGSHENNENNGKISGIKELEEIKKKNSNSDDNGKDLLKWCKSTYKKSYKGLTDNLWKLTEKYCKKTS